MVLLHCLSHCFVTTELFVTTKLDLSQLDIFIKSFLTLSAELKMELMRERELRESLEKQMGDEQRTKGKL